MALVAMATVQDPSDEGLTQAGAAGRGGAATAAVEQRGPRGARDRCASGSAFPRNTGQANGVAAAFLFPAFFSACTAPTLVRA